MSEFKEGVQALIIGNESEHGFRVGETVKLLHISDENNIVWRAVSLEDGEEWWVFEDDMHLLESNTNRLEQAREMAYKFNTIVGSDVSYETLLQKLERVEEEVEETFAAVVGVRAGGRVLKQNIDKKELLDGIVDIAYTLFGLMQIAEQLGYDVFGALEAVCANNDSKVCKTIEEANETAVMYEEQGIEVDIRYNEEYDVFAVVRKSDGKLMKPKGYKSVVLDQFLPKEN